MPSAVTDYEFTFSADAEFSTTDILVITFPPEINPFPTVTTSRRLAVLKKIKSIFTPWVNLTYTNTSNSIRIKGLFVNPY